MCRTACAQEKIIMLAVFIARYFAISLLAVALSHAAQPRLWRDFFIAVKRTGYAGIIISAFTFPLGLLLVLGHNVWVWDVPVIITICGWGMTIKSLSYALLPGRADRMIPEGANAHRLYAAGGYFGIAVSALLLYHYYFRGH
jgi:hypothetical protein